MIMGSSQGQPVDRQPSPASAGGARTLVLVGGGGRMGSLYAHCFERSGHEVRILETGDWDRLRTRSWPAPTPSSSPCRSASPKR